jgi:hypothetical protein
VEDQPLIGHPLQNSDSGEIETPHSSQDKMMDTLVRFYILPETKINNQINDKLTIKPNIIFETIVQEDPHRGLPAAYRHLKNST